MKHGFLLIDKPEGPTSHDVVDQIRSSLSERKVGHLGTLDPAASGVLVLAVGAKALKVIELFSALSKEYRADIALGTVSATFDREGPLETFARKPGVKDPDEHAILEAIRTRFLGKQRQIPPAASAVKIGGERVYRKMRNQMRAGLPARVDMPSREVEITRCDIVSYTYPRLTLYVGCSSGTYIRSLAHDLGQALRVGAYLSGLQRTTVGEWSLDDAVTMDDAAWANVIPLKEILKDHPSLALTDQQFEDMSYGRFIDGSCEKNTIAWHDGLPVAILEETERGVKARKVL